MADCPTIVVPTPPGGWGAPWPNVAEIATVLPHTRWTLVGGLMTQLHTVYHGLDVVRPTNDVDIVLHLETTRGLAHDAARALEDLGYRMLTSIDPRKAQHTGSCAAPPGSTWSPAARTSSTSWLPTTSRPASSSNCEDGT